MAILAIFTGTSITKEKYEALRAKVNWESQRPDGGILHVSSFDDNGVAHVADVWESQQALDAFVGQRLAPALQELRIEPPDVVVYPVHRIDAYEAIDSFVLR